MSSVGKQLPVETNYFNADKLCSTANKYYNLNASGAKFCSADKNSTSAECYADFSDAKPVRN